ncbi:MAG: ATP-binding protein [Anaerolineae bacterium]
MEICTAPLEVKRVDDVLVLLVDSKWLADSGVKKSDLDAMKALPLVLLLSQIADLPLINRLLLPQFSIEAILTRPFATEENRALLADTLERERHPSEGRKLQEDLAEANRLLNQRLQALNIIYTSSKFLVSSLDLEKVLSRLMDAALNLTRAEEGFILLRDDENLYLRAAKNLKEDYVKRFNVEISDKIAWQVIHSGRPVMLRRKTQIATDYLVRALLYVPLQTAGRGNIGVLAVINRERDVGFTEEQLFTLSSLADFAGAALENARLFTTIEAEESRLRTILRQATEAILLTDDRNRLILWSHTAGEVFDIPTDARGKPLEEVVDHTPLLELFHEIDDEAGHSHAELTLGEGQVFNAQLTAIGDLGRVAVMQDITHLKELDRLKTEFVSTVSHDLRTPLTTIQGYVELLDRVGPLNEMQKRFIHKALDSLSHITNLISDLLDIGRIEAGYDLEMKPLRLDVLISETGEAMQTQAAEAEISLTWELPKMPLRVVGNRRRLRQVLENLISNAIKYNQPGGRVHMKARLDDGHVVVSITDDGIGIPLEEQPRVFERFYRVHTTETEDIQGTGLGLAIVKSVIEKHKGRVWVKSMPGEGSTFSFILPANLEADGVEQREDNA